MSNIWLWLEPTLRCNRVRKLCDEIWCFVGAKAKNTTPEKKQEGWGDVWTTVFSSPGWNRQVNDFSSNETANSPAGA